LVSRGFKYRGSLTSRSQCCAHRIQIFDTVGFDRWWAVPFAPTPSGVTPQISAPTRAPPERSDGRSRPNANPGQTMGSFSGLARLAADTLSFPPTALLERVVGFGISHWYRDSKHCRYDGKRTCCDVMSLMGFCRLTTHFGARSLRSKVRASPSGEYVNVVRTPSTRYDTPRPALLV
jgi:hypothetical protein